MKITKDFRTNLIICLLSKSDSSKDGRLSIFHRQNQADLLEYKRKLLKPFIVNNELITKNINDKQLIGYLIKKTDFTRSLKRWIYPNGVKTISLKTLKKTTPLHLAIWWMDNGKIFYSKNDQGDVTSVKYILSMKLNHENNQVLINWFKSKHNISFYQKRHKGKYSLVCGTKEGIKLMKILQPYLI